MNYAAVIIPTLNRINHLTRCIESLKKNPESRNTDLYISVDYPPSKRFWTGYSDVVDYVKTISGFLSVNLYFQKTNLGPGLNYKFLIEKISEKHDKYIFTEDDNEFSSNFLSYVNWGLEEYKDNDSVYAICSCSDFEFDYNNIQEDYFFIQSYNAYGTGHWIHKNKRCLSFLTQKMINDFYASFSKQKMLFNNSLNLYYWVALDSVRRISAMRGQDDSLTFIDIWLNFYLSQNNLFCVKPVKAKSRNWGQDGSGVHQSESDSLSNKKISYLDSCSSWSLCPKRVEKKREDNLSKLHYGHYFVTKSNIVFAFFLYTLNYIFGNKAVHSTYNSLSLIYKFIFRKKSSTDDTIKYG